MEIANSSNQKSYTKGIQALEILASVVSAMDDRKPLPVMDERRPVNKTVASPQVSLSPNAADHRISCHRCGNIRKKKMVCAKASCPHIFCGRCSDKMKEEHGRNIFVGGCPVCKELCCCTNKTTSCKRLNHCYRKCPATKVARKPNEKRDGDNSFSIGKNGAFNEDDTEGLTNTSMILGRKRSAMEISPDCYADDILNSIYVSPALENNILSSYGNCSGDISRLKIPSLIGSSETGVIPGLLGSRSNTALPSILSHQAFAMLPQTCVFLWADDHSRLPTQTILSTVADSSALEIASRESDCNIASLVMDSTTNLE